MCQWGMSRIVRPLRSTGSSTEAFLFRGEDIGNVRARVCISELGIVTGVIFLGRGDRR